MTGLIDADHAVEYGLFARRQALAAGYSAAEIARRLRLDRWRRVGHGVYEEVGRNAREGDRIVRAFLQAGPHAVTTHLTAAEVLTWDLIRRPAPLQFTVPQSRGAARVPEGRVFRRDLRSDESCVVGVLRVTTPARTAIDIAADVPLLEAVVAVDAALRLQQVTIGELQRAARDHRFRPGAPRVKQVMSLIDPLSGSVPESVSRLLFVRTGLPVPVTQYVVRDEDGRFLARVDFAWPGLRLIVEIDGFEWHGGREAFQADHDRQNELELAGWTVLRFTAGDVRTDPEKVTRTVRRALAERGC